MRRYAQGRCRSCCRAANKANVAPFRGRSWGSRSTGCASARCSPRRAILRVRDAAGAPPGAPLMLPIPVAMRRDVGLATLLKLKDEIDRAPLDARFDLETKRLLARAVRLLARRLRHARALGRGVAQGAPEVERRSTASSPRLIAAQMGGVSFGEVLGWFETRYATDKKHEARTFNLRLAASKLDGHVICRARRSTSTTWSARATRRTATRWRRSSRRASWSTASAAAPARSRARCTARRSSRGSTSSSAIRTRGRASTSRWGSTRRWSTRRSRCACATRSITRWCCTRRCATGSCAPRSSGPSAVARDLRAQDRRGDPVRRDRAPGSRSSPRARGSSRSAAFPGFDTHRYRIVREAPSPCASGGTTATRRPTRSSAWGRPTAGDADEVADDPHPEYVADEYLVLMQGPDVKGGRPTLDPGEPARAAEWSRLAKPARPANTAGPSERAFRTTCPARKGGATRLHRRLPPDENRDRATKVARRGSAPARTERERRRAGDESTASASRRPQRWRPQPGNRGGAKGSEQGRTPALTWPSDVIEWPQSRSRRVRQHRRLQGRRGRAQAHRRRRRGHAGDDRVGRAFLGPADLVGHLRRPGGARHVRSAYPGEVHVDIARDVDLVLIAPATADVLARLALGSRRRSGDRAFALCRSGPVIWSRPRCTRNMWTHPATQRNVATLRGDGRVSSSARSKGPLASGESGIGRLAEPDDIAAAVLRELGARRRRARSRRACAWWSPPVPRSKISIRCASSATVRAGGWASRSPSARRARGQVTLIAGPVELCRRRAGVAPGRRAQRARNAGRVGDGAGPDPRPGSTL